MILVTGATGFLGSHLVEKLNSNNVRCLVRQDSDTSHLEKVGCEIFYGDITKKNTLANLCKDVDYVYHLAAQMNRWGISEEQFYLTNVAGTKNILELSIEENIKQFIYCSTASIIGPSNGTPLNEEYKNIDMSNFYKKTKAQAEMEVLKNSKKINTTIISPELIYGPRNYHYLPLFQTIKKGHIFLVGDGKNFMQPTYVDDVVQGFLKVLKNKKAFGEKFIIASEKPITSKELILEIADVLKVKKRFVKIPLWFVKSTIGILESIPFGRGLLPKSSRGIINFFTTNHSYDISKAKRILKYEPKVSLRKGLEMTIHWYEEKGLL